MLCSIALIILQIWNSSGTTGLAEEHIDQKTLERDKLTQNLVGPPASGIGQDILDQRGLCL